MDYTITPIDDIPNSALLIEIQPIDRLLRISREETLFSAQQSTHALLQGMAHEIKNPLTPIQLSAERIRRRYGKVITEDREVFDQCTDTIVRQVEDIGRMVDEFSSFARMPAPKIMIADLREPLKESTFLLRVANPDISFQLELEDAPMMASFDGRLLGQVFGKPILRPIQHFRTVAKRHHSRRHECRPCGRRLFIQQLQHSSGRSRTREYHHHVPQIELFAIGIALNDIVGDGRQKRLVPVDEMTL